MSYQQNNGPPTWFVLMVGIALVFALYYLWTGFRDYVSSGGLGIREATEQAEVVATATAERFIQQRDLPTPRPTATPIPECKDFRVTVSNAIVREQPTTNAGIVTSYFENDIVCVIEREGETEWYLIDTEPRTRRVNAAYMHESIIQAVNPTPTPTQTVTPAPTVTPVPTDTPSITPSPRPSPTRDPNATDTSTPTPTRTPTAPSVSV